MMQAKFKSLVSYLIDHARKNPNDLAYVFLSNSGAEEASITFAELEYRARALAGHLASHSAPGERAILVFPPGLDFIVGFFACLYAGIIAVPMVQPRRDRLRDANINIVKDCSPKLALTTSGFVEPVQTALRQVPGAAQITWFCTDATEFSLTEQSAEHLPDLDAQTIAYLQYTSGSTSTPKGAMITHGNLITNLQMLTVEYELGRDSTRVGWIPLYHDLGLVLNVLQASYVGALCVLMAPLAFVQRPLSWLRAIHEYKACFAAAPNFALDLCSKSYRPESMHGIDLSCLKWVIVGAEPVRADTLNRFGEVFAPFGLSYSSLRPSYGMAETVLMISGRKRNDGPTLWPVSLTALRKNLAVSPANGETEQTVVGCGMPPAGERIAIIDPVSCHRLGPGQVGEIWVHGPHVAKGYWQKPDITKQIFQAQVAGEENIDWLRTGDMGCLDEAGEVYVTGRIKDVIIFRGANYYPHDIELSAEKCHPALRPGHGAAFKVVQDEQEMLVIVYEVNDEYLNSAQRDELIQKIRMAVVQNHDLTVHHAVLIAPGTAPMTSSGKIRRNATRELWQSGNLKILDDAKLANTVKTSAPSALVE